MLRLAEALDGESDQVAHARRVEGVLELRVAETRERVPGFDRCVQVVELGELEVRDPGREVAAVVGGIPRERFEVFGMCHCFFRRGWSWGAKMHPDASLTPYRETPFVISGEGRARDECRCSPELRLCLLARLRERGLARAVGAEAENLVQQSGPLRVRCRDARAGLPGAESLHGIRFRIRGLILQPCDVSITGFTGIIHNVLN